MEESENWSVSARVLLTCVTFFLLFKVLFRSSSRKRNGRKYLENIPGPPPNIFFGNMLDFLGSTAEFFNAFRRYLKLYGKTIVAHDGPMSRLVGTADCRLMEFFLSSPKFIDKSENYEYFESWLGLGLLTSTGSKWKSRRRMITPSFHFSILENFVEVFNSSGNILIKKLDTHVDKEGFDIHPMISLYTLDVICEAAMGRKIDAQINENSEYVKSVKSMCAIITSRNFSPLHPRFYPLTWNSFRERRVVKFLHDHTDSVIDKRIEELKDITSSSGDGFFVRQRPAFLDLLIRSTIDGQPLSRLDIREEVDTFMFEGHDTIASAISFALYSLATNPSVQQKAVEEQMEIFGNLKTRETTIEDIRQMKYLDLVIKETLRLYPSVPLFARKLPEDIEYEGTWYPKDMKIVMVVFFMHRHPDYFPEPEKFIPERFLNNEGKNSYVYLPFSAGPRNCIGQKFAMLEMKCTLSKILRNYELLPTQPDHELQLAPEIILLSKNGIKLRIKRRRI